ncbi:MAG: hypothetical protein H0T82_05235 [Sphingomonas sp.]|nr:hypothetical protein [Sphingomonas sp.]
MAGAFDFIISLRVRHPTAGASDIAQLVGLKADRSWSTSEPRTTPQGRSLDGYRDETYCAFRLDAGSDGQLAKCIGTALETLKFRRAALEKLRLDGGSLVLFVSWHCTGDTGETFSSWLLGELAVLGIDLNLNVLSAQS